MRHVSIVHGHKIYKHDDGGYFDHDKKFYAESLEKITKGINEAYEEGYISDIMDAHYCSQNAEYSEDGPAGSGYYCEICGALVELR